MKHLQLSEHQLRDIARELLLAHLRLSRAQDRRTAAYRQRESTYSDLCGMASIVFSRTPTHCRDAIAQELEWSRNLGRALHGDSRTAFSRHFLSYTAEQVMHRLVD